MSLLIIGGLFALAVVALLGAVLLGISEQRRDAARAKEAAIQASLPVEPPPATSRPTVPLDRATALLPRDEDTDHIRLNGQYHELASEIRELHQQAWELEQRLSALTDMVDRVERSRNGHTSIEEETPSM